MINNSEAVDMVRKLNESYNKNIKDLAYKLIRFYDISDPNWVEGADDIDVNWDIIKSKFPDLYDFIIDNDINSDWLWALYADLDDYKYDFPYKKELTMLTFVNDIINNYGKEDVAEYIFRPLIIDDIDTTEKELGMGYVKALGGLLDYAKSINAVNKDETLEKICNRTANETW